MSKLWTRFISIIVISIAWFIVLFDPTALALGLKIFTNIPIFVLGMAELLGNLAWLHGVLMLCFAALLLTITFYDDLLEKFLEKPIKKQLEKDSDNISPYTLVAEDEKFGAVFVEFGLWKNILTVHGVILTLVAIASGFWFTGSAWLLAIAAAYLYRYVGIKMAEEMIAEEKENMQVNVRVKRS